MTPNRHTAANTVKQRSSKLPRTEAAKMRNAIAAMICAVLLAGSTVAQQNQAEVDLQSAIRTETVDGDLKTAIQKYESLISKYKQERPIAAMALVHMAECYQKLGNAESRKLYERVVREYADQKEAVAMAREGIGGTEKAGPVKGDRAVWTGDKVDGFGTISRDGRFLTYTDWGGTGGIVLRDLNTGAERRITAGTYADGQGDFSVISKDGEKVVYNWLINATNRYEVRITSLQGSGVPESRRLFYSDDYKELSLFDWSPDAKWIAVSGLREDMTGVLGLLNSRDGSLRVLKSVDWQGPRRMYFSPDGRYVAYDLPVSDDPAERDIYVIAVDGSRETTAVKHRSHNTTMGWSPDGSQLLFASDRSGSFGLWGLPIASGKPRGEPTLLKADIGTGWSLGMSAAGTMYVWKGSPLFVGISSIDLSTGKLSPTAGTDQHFIQSWGRADWSRDGKYLAYQNCGALGGGPCTLNILSVETGHVRELQPKLRSFFFPRWSPDGRIILLPGTDLKGQRGIYSFDPATVNTALVAQALAEPEWASDGKSIYYAKPDVQRISGQKTIREFVLMQHEMASGQEREILRKPIEIGNGNTWSLSPDGRSVALISRSPDNLTSSTVFVVPMDGGEARPVYRVNAPEKLEGAQVMAPAWTPDSQAVIVVRWPNGDVQQRELWRVPVNGEQPRKLDRDIKNWSHGAGFRLSPDGRRIAFAGGTGKGPEIWALENFLPKLSAKR